MSVYQPDDEVSPRRSPNVWLMFGGIASLLLVVALAVGGGYWWGRNNTLANPPAVALSVANAQPVAGQPIADSTPEDLEQQFKVFWEVWDLVGKEFYHTKPIDQQKMIYGATRGMLQSLGDDFTGFQEPQAAEQSREQMSGQFEGIGAYVEFKDDQVLIVSPIEGSPAERADLRAGDVIIAADGNLMSEITADLERDLALQEAIKLIRGPKGSTVKLTIFRPSDERQFDIEIVRDAIPIISVRSAMIGDVGYISLSEFKQTSYDELDAAISKLKAQNPKAIVFDLRNDPGGFVNQARNVMGRFVKDGVTYIHEDSDGNQKVYNVLQEGNAQTLFDLPVIVLVNGGSASASEIVAGAFQDLGRAKLLGEKTFGKGSVQSVHQLADESEARITIAHWLTPNKRAIHEVGITPDYVVPFSDDAAEYPVECILNQKPAEGQTTCADSQLFWALKVLNENATPPPPPAPTATPTAK